MNPIRPLLLAAMMILPVAFYPTGSAVALNATSSVDARIRLNWEVGTTHAGRPVIQGWVYNDYGQAAKGVRLLVETLDGSGDVVARDTGFVFGTIAANGRTEFEVPLKKTGAS
ncbi:MAG TPA: hypothetical protein VEH80_11150, partial [Candidatus Bathyarchaeia archaeon]|nr:hypothetical protein [Candidatus Bathyarchaeia archaeon]